MALRDYPKRLLSAAILSSSLVLLGCGTVAVLLAREQTRTADVLEENIGSHRAAANLEAIFATLAVLHQEGVKDAAPLHEQAEEQLASVERLADKDKERELARRVVEGYRAYQAAYSRSHDSPGPKPNVVHVLQSDSLPACRRLQDFNMAQIDQSEREHRASLRRMTWGLAAVGGLGSVGGLVLGYGLARGLRRTIQRFLIQVRGAAELLGTEPARVEWERKGEPDRDGAADLLVRVEQAVVRLQEREREIRRAERLAAMGQLAAGVAHEIRNPLTTALLLFQMVRKDPSAGGLTDEDRDLIEQELQRIDRSLQSFLDFARPPQLARSDCDLVGVLRDALALARGRLEAQRVGVDLIAPVDGCPLHADPDQLRQVVLNLILNALDAMPQGGRVRVNVRCSDGYAELTVADTGAGIPAPILDRLFEPFVTGKETGIGLGLVTSKRIVDDHRGTIRGANRPGGGAEFVVRLPAGAGGEE